MPGMVGASMLPHHMGWHKRGHTASWLYNPYQLPVPPEVKLNALDVVVLLRWAAELHHSCSLTPPPQRKRGRKYNEKGSRVEIRMGKSLNNYNHRQNRLSIGRLEKR